MPDGSGVAVTARDLETEISQVWFVSYPDGDARRITNDLANYIGLSMTKDASTMVSIQLERYANIWTAQTSGGPDAKRLTSEQRMDEGLSGVAWTPDGRIVYTVRETGNQDLWIVNADGTEPMQLTKDAGSNFYPAASPDGKYLVFVSTRSDDINLWRTDINGRSPYQLTYDPGIEGAPSFSPDGKTVVYQITDKGNQTSVWRIDIEGGRPQKLAGDQSGMPAVSPDGKWIACEFGEISSGEAPKIALLPFEGGAPEVLLDIPEMIQSREFRWSPDSRGLLFIKTEGGIGNIFMQPINSGPAVKITNFTGERIYRFDVSPKGDAFVLARGTEGSNVVMIRDFR
jgi:Tol biopolymer transport system component